jgi:DNA-binding CsgD family transcriptional regulator
MCDEDNNLTDHIMLNGNLQARDDYLKHYYGLDFLIPKRVNHLLNKQRVLRIEDILPLQSYENSEFYNEFMARYGYYHTMGVYLHEGNKILGLIDFVRSKKERPFTNSDVRCLEVISRYLSQKVKICLFPKENASVTALMQPSANHSKSNLQVQKEYGLTLKESEVLELVQQGYSNTDIANQLFISTNTIKKHLQSIYRKFDV